MPVGCSVATWYVLLGGNACFHLHHGQQPAHWVVHYIPQGVLGRKNYCRRHPITCDGPNGLLDLPCSNAASWIRCSIAGTIELEEVGCRGGRAAAKQTTTQLSVLACSGSL